MRFTKAIYLRSTLMIRIINIKHILMSVIVIVKKNSEQQPSSIFTGTSYTHRTTAATTDGMNTTAYTMQPTQTGKKVDIDKAKDTF